MRDIRIRFANLEKGTSKWRTTKPFTVWIDRQHWAKLTRSQQLDECKLHIQHIIQYVESHHLIEPAQFDLFK